MIFLISNFTSLTLLFKLSKHANLRVFWISKMRIPNRQNPFYLYIYIYIDTHTKVIYEQNYLDNFTSF